MKSILILLSFLLLNIDFAHSFEYQQESAEIYSIDEGDSLTPENIEVEDPLPTDNELKSFLNPSSFTSISEATAQSLFNGLKGNSRARMRYPGGACSSRRIYIQNYLKNKGIRSGRLYLSCPSKNGRLRLLDQVSGRYFTYSNFHDTNVVLVGSSYRVMDVQFESSPVSLQTYLGKMRVYQSIQPAKNTNTGTCYWKITSGY